MRAAKEKAGGTEWQSINQSSELTKPSNNEHLDRFLSFVIELELGVWQRQNAGGEGQGQWKQGKARCTVVDFEAEAVDDAPSLSSLVLVFVLTQSCKINQSSTPTNTSNTGQAVTRTHTDQATATVLSILLDEEEAVEDGIARRDAPLIRPLRLGPQELPD